MRRRTSDRHEVVRTLPVPILLSALVAMSAFRAERGLSPAVLLDAALLVIAQMVPYRYRTCRYARSPARLIAVVTILDFLLPVIYPGVGAPAMGPLAALGLACAGVLAAYAWRPPDDPDHEGWLLPGLTGMVLLASLDHRDPVRSVVLSAMVLSGMLAYAAGSAHPGAGARIPPALLATQVTACLGVLIAGVAMVAVITPNRTMLSKLWADIGHAITPKPKPKPPKPSRTDQPTQDTETRPSSADIAAPDLGDGPGEGGGVGPALLELRGPVETELLRGRSYIGYFQGRWVRQAPFHSRYLAELRGPVGVHTGAISVAPLASGSVIYLPLNCRGFTGGGTEYELVDPGAGLVLDRTIEAYRYLPGVPPGQPGLAGRPPDPRERRQLLEVPGCIDPRVRRLAGRITKGLGAPLDRIAAIKRHLAARHGYSKGYHATGGDPVSTFILGNRPAHCAYFASASVILMRCAGIPSRLVTGYLVHRDGPGVVKVRSTDAHGWAEAYITGVGWITVDATPPGWVVSPSLPERARERLDDWAGFVSRKLARIRWDTVLLIFMASGAIGWIVMMVGTWWERRSSAPVPWRYAAPDWAMARAARRFTRACRNLRVPLEACSTWSECARLLDRQRAPHRHEVLSFIEQYNALRFGRITVSGLARMEVTLRRLERLGQAMRGRRKPRR